MVQLFSKTNTLIASPLQLHALFRLNKKVTLPPINNANRDLSLFISDDTFSDDTSSQEDLSTSHSSKTNPSSN